MSFRERERKSGNEFLVHVGEAKWFSDTYESR